jgi:hypothetical protein
MLGAGWPLISEKINTKQGRRNFHARRRNAAEQGPQIEKGRASASFEYSFGLSASCTPA